MEPHSFTLSRSQPVADSGSARTRAAFTLDDSDLASVVSELDARGVRFEDYDLPGFKTEGRIVEDPSGMRSVGALADLREECRLWQQIDAAVRGGPTAHADGAGSSSVG